MNYLIVNTYSFDVIKFDSSIEVYDFLVDYLCDAENVQITFEGGKINFNEKMLVQKIFRVKKVTSINNYITIINTLHK